MLFDDIGGIGSGDGGDAKAIRFDTACTYVYRQYVYNVHRTRMAQFSTEMCRQMP